jgi:hypothetical protein
MRGRNERNEGNEKNERNEELIWKCDNLIIWE